MKTNKGQTSWCGMPPVRLPFGFTANLVSAEDKQLRRNEDKMARREQTNERSVALARMQKSAQLAADVA